MSAAPPELPTSAAPALRVERLGADASRWDAFASADSDATFCHRAAWREVMEDVLGHETLYLVARDEDGVWRGILPLVRVRSRLFGHYLVSMPFLNYGGPLGSETAAQELALAATEEARRSGADLLELRTRHHLPIPEPLRRLERKITVLLDLPATVEELWERTLRAKLRSQIRRPIKAGMEVRFGPEQVAPFYEVFARNMRDLGTPVLPRQLFERIQSSFGAAVTFGVVYMGRKPVAAGCGFGGGGGGEFEMTWASALREHNREAPNMLLYCRFMERMIGEGIGRFNFGRCTPDGGTHRFKQQWGGFDVSLPWLHWSMRGVASTPSPEGRGYRLATRAWSRLPVSLATGLGPRLSRVIP